MSDHQAVHSLTLADFARMRGDQYPPGPGSLRGGLTVLTPALTEALQHLVDLVRDECVGMALDDPLVAALARVDALLGSTRRLSGGEP